MKQLEKKDLIKDEIYKHENGNLVKYQFDGDINDKIKGSYIGHNADYFSRDPTSNFTISSLILATQEEKYWLEECIKVDEFITFEEAMKTFIPEYVEWVNNIGSGNLGYQTQHTFQKNKIFKTDIELPTAGFQNQNWKSHLEIYPNNYIKSTKEAYDAQFVVKKPEFVLPEKWCVKSNEEIYDILQNYCLKNIGRKPLDKDKKSVYHFPDFNGVCTNSGIIHNYVEITFEQFKKYVLKEQLEKPKDKILEKEGIDLNIGKIIRVESSEGAIYQLGDKITVFTKDSPNKCKVFTIKGFRWNNAKTNICAITELHTTNGIGLDKIELYSELVVKELSLLEQAKLKYPIGTKVRSLIGNTCIITQQSHVDLRNSDGYCKNTDSIWFTASPYSPLIYRKGQWAEIVEDFQLPEKWCVEVNEELRNRVGYYKAYGYHHSIQINDTNKWSNKIKEGFTEITFEQFEQYVLHNGFKVGDIISNGNQIIYDLQYIDGHSVAFYKYCHNNYSGPQCRILTKNIVK